MTAWRGRLVASTRYIVAAISSAVFAVSFGFDYGVDNQVAYLLSGLRMSNSSILNEDWYAAKTTHYHPAFGYLSGLLLMVDKSGWSIALALILVITACMTLVYWLVELIAGRRIALPAFLIVLTFAFVTRTQSVGVSYIVDHILQPSTLGSLGFLAALPLYLSGRWLASGIALGLGGLFHANFLMLGFPVYGFAHLLQGRPQLVRRGLFQLGPSLVALLVLAPVVLASARSPVATEAQHIYFFIRSPHHYRPETYEANFIPFAAWQMVGVGLGALYMRRATEQGRRLGAFFVALFALLWTGTVLTTATYVPRVAQLFVWRLAPFSDLLCQVFAAITIVHIALEPRFARRFGFANWASALAGFGVLLMFNGNHKDKELVTLLLVVGLPFAAVIAGAEVAARFRELFLFERVRPAWQKFGPWVVSTACAALVVPHARPALTNAMQRSTLLRGLPKADGELFSWMRNSTPKDAQFLSPPDIETIRYHGQRGIVVDWKSTPILPAELVEWRNRLVDVTGRTQFRGSADLAGYSTLDQSRLDLLKQKYHFQYVIVRRGRERGLQGERVFENASFVVLRV